MVKTTVGTLLILYILSVASYTAHAQCSCIPDATLPQYFDRVDVVFVGRVTEATEPGVGSDYAYIEFEAEEVWKGHVEKVVTVREFQGSVIGFEVGSRWLLYAFRDINGDLRVVRGCCSRTALVTTAEKRGDFDGLRKLGIRPRMIDEESTQLDGSAEPLKANVPDAVMKQVVRRIIKWYFGPRSQPRKIYLLDKGIKRSWLPEVKNVEFVLVPSEGEKPPSVEGVYFFREPVVEGKSFSIGFGFGDPDCTSTGDYWSFRLDKNRVRLWLPPGGWGSGCSSGSGGGRLR